MTVERETLIQPLAKDFQRSSYRSFMPRGDGNCENLRRTAKFYFALVRFFNIKSQTNEENNSIESSYTEATQRVLFTD